MQIYYDIGKHDIPITAEQLIEKLHEKDRRNLLL